MSDLRTDLESLLAHPGWQWLVTTERDHWRNEMDRYLTQASNEREENMALSKLRQVLAAKQAVERVFTRPENEVTRLTAQAASAAKQKSHSRRGPL